MTRVLVDGIVFGHQGHGGISRVFSEILPRMVRHYPELELVLHLPSECLSCPPRGQGIMSVTDFHRRPWRLWSRANLHRLKRRRPSLFHSTYYRLPYWPGLKSVVTVYDFIHEKLPSIVGEDALVDRKRRAIEQADAVVAISQYTASELLGRVSIDPAKVEVIHLAAGNVFMSVAPEEFVQTFLRARGIRQPYWLYVGRRGLYKNFGTLLRAFCRIARATESALVLVGGEPDLEPWQVDTLEQHGCGRQVCIAGSLSDEDLHLAYAGAAGFVFPSLEEGFGIPLLEAMGSGAPVIASDIPVFHEVAGEAALYFQPHDDEALADAMTRVLEARMRRSLTDKGLARARQYSWDTAARKYAEVYRRLA